MPMPSPSAEVQHGLAAAAPAAARACASHASECIRVRIPAPLACAVLAATCWLCCSPCLRHTMMPCLTQVPMTAEKS